MDERVLPVPLKNIVLNRVPMNSCFIYVLGEEDFNRIKIGRSRNFERLRKRIIEHEKRGPDTVPMRVLAIVRGFNSDEGFLKNHFKKLVVGGDEWLDATDIKLRDWIRFLRCQPYVAHTIEEAESIPQYDGSSVWLPKGENFKHISLQETFDFEPKDRWADLNTYDMTEGDYYTNEKLIEAARNAMGSIDLDPSSCRDANRVVKAKKFYGVKEDGLCQPWFGRIWLNPPFGDWDKWTPKLFRELNNISQICVFATANASTNQCFHPIVKAAAASFYPNGRISCWGPKASEAREGNFIFYLGNRIEEFRSSFSSLGTVFVK